MVNYKAFFVFFLIIVGGLGIYFLIDELRGSDFFASDKIAAPEILNNSGNFAMRICFSHHVDSDGFKVHYGTDKNNLIVTDIGLPDKDEEGQFVISTSDLDMEEGNHYYVAISSYKEGWKDSDPSNFDEITIPSSDVDFSYPLIPSGFGAVAVDGDIRVDWDENKEDKLVGYNVYYGRASREYELPVLVLAESGNSYLIEGLTGGETYYVAIASVSDSVGHESGLSEEIPVNI